MHRQFIIKRRLNIALVIVAILFGIVGTVLLILAHATAPGPISVEPETTNRACASKLSDSTASASKAIRFKPCLDSGGLDATGWTIPDSNYAVSDGFNTACDVTISNCVKTIFMAPTAAQTGYSGPLGSDSCTVSDPACGSKTKPVASLNKAVSLLSNGATIVVYGGSDANPVIYRDWYSTVNSSLNTNVIDHITKSLHIQAYPHQKAWFDGSDVKAANKWNADGNGHFRMSWTTNSFCGADTTDTDPTKVPYYQNNFDDPTSDQPCVQQSMAMNANKLAADPQMVFIDCNDANHSTCVQAHQETSLSQVTATSFYYDRTAKKLYIGADPASHTIQVAARPAAMILNGDDSTVRGLGFRRYATNENNASTNTRSAILSIGTGTAYENDVFTQMAAGGLSMSKSANGAHVNHTVFAHNGYVGFFGNGGDGGYALTNSVASYNNEEHFGYDCTDSAGKSVSCLTDGAGVKIVTGKHFLVKNNIFTHNAGNGFWGDTGSETGTIVDNTADHNDLSGINYEVSSDALIASNLVMNNARYGIQVGSAHLLIYNNTLITNGAGGIWVYDDVRPADGTPSVPWGPNTTDVSIVNNVIYDSVLAIKAQGKVGSQTSPLDTDFFTAINHNSYYRTAGATQDLFVWVTPDGDGSPPKCIPSETGPSFTRCTHYKTDAALSLIRAAYPSPLLNGTRIMDDDQEDSTITKDPFFNDLPGLDFHIRGTSPAYHSGAALPDDARTAQIGAKSLLGNQTRGVLVWTTIP